MKSLNDEEWKVEANRISLDIVMNVRWPWTERQKKLWFTGVLSDIFTREALENADISKLQEMYNEVHRRA